MWFSLYTYTTPTEINLKAPIPYIYFVVEAGMNAALHVYQHNGSREMIHSFPDPIEAQIYAAERYQVPLDMWVNAFNAHPIEDNERLRRSQFRHLSRSLAQSCRPVSVIDYALRMKYDPKRALHDFAEIRTLLQDQIPFEQRHDFAMPYIRRSLLCGEASLATITLYRNLTFCDEATARSVILDVDRQLHAGNPQRA